MLWKDCSFIESQVKREGASLRPITILVSDISEKLSRDNQNRPQQSHLDVSTVDRYATSMKEGDIFPKIAIKEEGDKYVIIDGNHRHAAFRRVSKDVLIDVYLVWGDSAPMSRLTKFVNLGNGLPLTVSESMELVRNHMENHPGDSTETIAASARVSATTILKWKRTWTTRLAIEEGNVSTKNLSNSVIERLAMIRDNDPILLEAARWTARAGISAVQVAEMIRSVKAKRTQETKLKAIEDYCIRLIGNGASDSSKPRGKKEITNRRLVGLLGFLESNPTRSSLGLDADVDFQHASKQVRELIEALRKVIGE